MESPNSENEALNLYTRLLAERIVFLTAEIADEVADSVVAQLLFLESQNPGQDIRPPAKVIKRRF